MARHPNYSGLVVAGVGFFLTRFTVTLALNQDPFRFYLGGVVPLALGLGLAAFGVALTVANVDPALVRTTALWCVIGAASMLVLVVLTLLASSPTGMLDLETIRSQTYLSNFLIGGSIGGTFTGLYAARNRRQRRLLRQQRNRLEVLNRLLRHEILNAVTAIRGYATLGDRGGDEATEVVERRSADIEATIEEVKHLTRQSGRRGASASPTSLRGCLRDAVETVQERHPEAELVVPGAATGVEVRADDRLANVFTHLLENAVVHGEDDSPSIDVSIERGNVRISVRDTGPGLPAGQARLLETGDIDEFDNPKTGFGLNIVRLFVETYGGSIETDVDDEGTTIDVVLPRVERDGIDVLSATSDLAGVGPAIPHLMVVIGAALVAGVSYAVVTEAMGASVAGIGVFYGTVEPTVGWITHEFHSVVFGLVYLGLLALLPHRYHDNVLAYLLVGIGWGLALWILAAGIVAPIWLRLLGIPATLPNLTLRFLATHLAWGITLALGTALGFRYVSPRLRALSERWQARRSAR